MRYVRVTWHHDFDDEPVTIFSELGDDRYETRKVQIYRDGRTEWSDESRETGGIVLSEVPFPEDLEEIDSQTEFSAGLIDADEFEQAWREARAHL
jgi:hypothetical protein